MSPRKFAACWCRDVLGSLLGRGDELIPPSRWMFDGSQNPTDFRRDGQEFLEYFREFGGLAPDDRVLDIGSGIGRMAIPLTGYLSGNGHYEGFDIVKLGVDWCTSHITRRFPNFRFQLADVYNGLYNVTGSQNASEYRFPYPDGSFDFVFATSVFTHTLPSDLENYVGEIARVLASGGRAFTNFFLLQPESEELIGAGRSQLSFNHPYGVARMERQEVLEGAVAFPEDYVRSLLADKGMDVSEPIRLGSWCGRANYLTFQDVVISSKRATG